MVTSARPTLVVRSSKTLLWSLSALAVLPATRRQRRTNAGPDATLIQRIALLWPPPLRHEDKILVAAAMTV
jgi:hypothetical protein